MIKALEAELSRLGTLDEGRGQGGVVVRAESSGVVTVTDGTGEAVVRPEAATAELKRLPPSADQEDVWAALAKAKLHDPTECNGCEKLYEYEQGTDNATGSRFCPDCSSRDDVAAF